jgi:hypothetical protein
VCAMLATAKGRQRIAAVLNVGMARYHNTIVLEV